MKQLAMKFRSWGGKRRRAGRKPKGARPGVPHVPREQPRRTPVHVTTEAEDALALERGMKGLAVRMARRLNKAHGLRGQVFPDRFHSRALESPREVAYAIRYVLGNHMKHGLAHWDGRTDPYSSPAHPMGPAGLTVRPKLFLTHMTLEGRWLALASP